MLLYMTYTAPFFSSNEAADLEKVAPFKNMAGEVFTYSCPGGELVCRTAFMSPALLGMLPSSTRI